ncbi:hypothetical protein [Geodermatophilus sabuli]|uniref:Uncharacterized protein n=1 Tax=Geodermatophilus sabuli TaxID=1564158 RepID=A0A285E910_9ACTN|nr:hypothetical protein [Geodermatophilus sabuli]MBB3084984.1 hypothetical protein [Geodermatophilus sabuli]SNX95608.1 hypothetical protein SAMN06893097_102308 [Geodermatophilus sabuli]
MGRHSAADDAVVHPVVAAALARRPAGLPAARHGDLRADSTESELGWPGESTTHEGLGWPGGMSAEPARQAGGAAEQPARPRGWRRFFRAA